MDQVVYNNVTQAFDVYATPTHNSASVQSFTMSVSENESGANVSSASGTVDYVAETPAATQTGFVNTNINFNLGNITDLGSNNDTVSINWDPTNPNSASVTTLGTLNPDGSITGAFDYAAIGSYNPRITITDPLYGVFLINDSINVLANLQVSLFKSSILDVNNGQGSIEIGSFSDPGSNIVNPSNYTVVLSGAFNTVDQVIYNNVTQAFDVYATPATTQPQWNHLQCLFLKI